MVSIKVSLVIRKNSRSVLSVVCLRFESLIQNFFINVVSDVRWGQGKRRESPLVSIRVSVVITPTN